MSEGEPEPEPHPPLGGALSRRQFLQRAGLVGAGVAAGAVLGPLASLVRDEGGGASAGAATIPFHGPHQAGIATPVQDRLCFAAFDVTSTDRAQLRELLRTWTHAARALTAGRPVGRGIAGSAYAPPDDTGEAFGLPAARLTLTFGFGPTLFDRRFGLHEQRPAALVDLPAFPGDELEELRGGGDLCVQACADDPQVAFHAVRTLARIGRGTAAMRWLQLGFGRTSTTSRSQDTPRNLMGFKDGTNNITLEDHDALDRYVWADAADGAPWMHGGSYVVARRIRMLIESWDRAPLDEQERTIGRRKPSGAPFGGHGEFDRVDLAKLPAGAHVREAAPARNGGERILRRGYSYTDGMDVDRGQLDAGLFFIAYQRDPRRQFVSIQRRLASSDALNEYLLHTGSAIFACPPGVANGSDAIGAALFDG